MAIHNMDVSEIGSSAPAEVCYISSDTILPATRTDSTQRLELAAWDLSLLAKNAIQKGLLFHKPTEETWLARLKTSLSRTLDHFFPLAGRLGTEFHEDDTISVFIQCNNAGAEFIHAAADLTVSDVLDPPYLPHIVHDFFPLNGQINYDGRFNPLLAIQVTELIDGVFIGCSINHTMADGGSFWHFMNSWSEICKSGSDQISRPPILDRWFPSDSDPPIRLPASGITNVSYTLPPLEEQVFHFAPQNVAKLKAQANTNNNDKVISSLQAVLAHVWIAFTRVKNFDPDQEVNYQLIMGNRGRLDPPLPEEYFGNSIGTGTATTKVGELMTQGLGFAAGLLNEVVSSHTHAKICNAWENWVKEPTINRIGKYGGRIILVTGSSPRFNVYGNDFGWGSPIAVRSGCGNKYEGKMTVYPGVGKGSMDLQCCLSLETLRDMGQDAEFMEYVGADEDGKAPL